MMQTSEESVLKEVKPGGLQMMNRLGPMQQYRGCYYVWYNLFLLGLACCCISASVVAGVACIVRGCLCDACVAINELRVCDGRRSVKRQVLLTRRQRWGCDRRERTVAAGAGEIQSDGRVFPAAQWGLGQLWNRGARGYATTLAFALDWRVDASNSLVPPLYIYI